MTYHYNLFIHNQAGNEHPSGIAELPGNDFIVSLGSFTNGVGSTMEQESAFMHELGHNIKLRHGGGVAENCKPNYLSVMNYAFMFANRVPSRPLDYSRATLSSLNENVLNENSGVKLATSRTGATLTTVYGHDDTDIVPPEDLLLSLTGIAINWNRDGDSTDTSVKININHFGGWTSAADCKIDNSWTTLTGYDDWRYMDLRFTGSSDFADGAHDGSTHTDITAEDVLFTRLAHLKSLDNAVQRIEDSKFGNSTLAMALKSQLHGKIQSGPDSIAQSVSAANYDGAIAQLNQLRTNFDGSVGGNKVGDLVTDTETQTLIIQKIDTFIAVLEIASDVEDKTPPVVRMVTPFDGATYKIDQNITAEWYAFDFRTGEPFLSASVERGMPIDTSRIGTHEFTVYAKDANGNETTQSITYYVTN